MRHYDFPPELLASERRVDMAIRQRVAENLGRVPRIEVVAESEQSILPHIPFTEEIYSFVIDEEAK